MELANDSITKLVTNRYTYCTFNRYNNYSQYNTKERTERNMTNTMPILTRDSGDDCYTLTIKFPQNWNYDDMVDWCEENNIQIESPYPHCGHSYDCCGCHIQTNFRWITTYRAEADFNINRG